jgi:hypothetical protein
MCRQRKGQRLGSSSPVTEELPSHIPRRDCVVCRHCTSMTTRTLYLISSRPNPNQRAHFSIFVPSERRSNVGSLIHVIGAPMVGYGLEFKRNYCPELDENRHQTIPLGHTNSDNIVDSTDEQPTLDSTPRANVERVAAQLPPPRISQNFLVPVNNVSGPLTVLSSFLPSALDYQ